MSIPKYSCRTGCEHVRSKPSSHVVMALRQMLVQSKPRAFGAKHGHGELIVRERHLKSVLSSIARGANPRGRWNEQGNYLLAWRAPKPRCAEDLLICVVTNFAST